MGDCVLPARAPRNGEESRVNGLSAADLFDLVSHFLLLSLLSIGGAMSAAPEMHRYFVVERGWLDETGFVTSIALAQAAPGPNVTFVAVVGYQIAGLVGALAALCGILLPSTLLSLRVSRWLRTHRTSVGVQAFTAGLAPMTVGLLLATSWVLLKPFLDGAETVPWGPILLIALTVWCMLRTRLAPIWLILMGGLVGALGYG